jgi:hypothetical protein
MEAKATTLRERLHAEHSDWDWRQRQHAIEEM